jgi:hypothetical protein
MCGEEYLWVSEPRTSILVVEHAIDVGVAIRQYTGTQARKYSAADASSFERVGKAGERKRQVGL